MSGLQIYGAGRAGDGTNTNVTLLGQALKDMGAWTFFWRDEVYSNIQTRDSGFGLRAADHPVFGPDDEFDILEAFDDGAIVDIANEGRIPPITRLKEGGVLIYDSTPRLDYPNAGHEVKLEKVAGPHREPSKITAYGLPMGQMAKEKLDLYSARGTIAVGVIAHLIGMPDESMLNRFAKRFGDGSDVYKMNAEALAIGREYANEQGWETPELKVNFTPIAERRPPGSSSATRPWAPAPSSPAAASTPATRSRPPPRSSSTWPSTSASFGGAMIQADTEMAAAHHVIGAAVAGARSMTATSGPGFSLMQEAISAGGITETPMVIVLCTRGGPGTGLPTRQGQEELNEAIFGGHGDFARIVLAVSEPEDSFYVMEHVFNLAERYQCPVFLLLDQMLAQSSYTVPALDPSGFIIDRGKLLSPAAEAGAPRRYVKNGNATTSATRSPRTASPTAPSPARPACTNYYTNTNEHTEDGYITEEEVVRQRADGQALHAAHGAHHGRPGPARSRACTATASAKIGFISYGGTLRPHPRGHGAPGRRWASRPSSWSCARSGPSTASRSRNSSIAATWSTCRSTRPAPSSVV